MRQRYVIEQVDFYGGYIVVDSLTADGDAYKIFGHFKTADEAQTKADQMNYEDEIAYGDWVYEQMKERQ